MVEGDFMPQRRYRRTGKDAYMLPYNGEEVKLHWASTDQYYIKTTENFQSYLFRLGPEVGAKRVRFQVAAADLEQDNIKASNGRARYFVLTAGRNAVLVDDAGLLTINFEHRPLTEAEKSAYTQKKTRPTHSREQPLRRTADGCRQLSTAIPSSAFTSRPRLSIPSTRHCSRRGCPRRTMPNARCWRSIWHVMLPKTASIIFIHKDLGSFLKRELDYYIKNEVLVLDDLDVDDPVVWIRARSRMAAIRNVGNKIIDFLAQLEDFQKQIWLKKKFVVSTHYCITLDRVPDRFYADIAANTDQLNEWEHLFAISELYDGSTRPLPQTFLRSHPHLIVDTRHFTAEFRAALLGALSDVALSAGSTLDEQTDGLLIHSENFQALGLLQARYAEQVQCIYIDPPYNTNASEIIYKNGYKHSSWLSLMENRFELGKNLLTGTGVQITAIDDNELSNLSQILDATFVNSERKNVIVNHHPAGAGLEGANISETHEYALFVMPAGEKVLHGKSKNGGLNKIGFIRTGTASSNLRIGRPNSFYAVIVDPLQKKVIRAEPPPQGSNYPTEDTEEGFKRIYPKSRDGTERVWRRSYESFFAELEKGNIICQNGYSLYLMTEQEGKHHPIFSNWFDKKYNAGTYGTNLLKDIIGPNDFSYPKSIHTVTDCVASVCKILEHSLVVDYFAGSGTTGHTVINLNREDGGKRKYILVEMGQYFDTVLKPRIQKVIYSKDWKNGKPLSREGSSHCFKYISLESYEDAMDNLEVKLAAEDSFDFADKGFREDYLLRYALKVETRASATLLGKTFDAPDRYELSITRGQQQGQMPADLSETFNYLIGLRVAGQWHIDGITAIRGADPRGREHLILWRDITTHPSLAEANAALDHWWTKHRSRFIDSETENSAASIDPAPDIDVIYVNGSHTLNAMRTDNERWEAKSIEPMFHQLMFRDVE